ncbi:hypothetical protein N1031_06955 [Herbiconiux moechotypicola]|uniref:Uncharacterized protein n=1 Tax=Herbiconiux moechotypicola TaxID=637393 RepID=A0ABN3DGC5_9MICO|nr:hypothetical protein [Herbiconiux moechotypicola]MCS5729495.1 hypothetical protein [Herbiconiux moechotypicola]
MNGQEYPSASTWATRLNGFDTGSTTFQLGASKLTRADWHELIDPWRRTVEVCWDDQIVYSGLMMGTTYDRSAATLTVASAEVRTILARRMLFPIGGYATGTKNFTSRTLRGLIFEILQLATQGDPSVVWRLPFSFDGLSAEIGPEARTYFAYLFENAEKLITDLQDADGGPDVHFQARWASDLRREWLVRLGSPKLSGPARSFTTVGRAPTALNVQETLDGTQMVTGIFLAGAGSEEDMLHGEAATVAAPGGYPSLDVVRQAKKLTDQSQLNVRAAAERDAFRLPTKQLSFDVLARDFLPDGVPGSPVALWDEGDFWLPDGQNYQRCIGMRGDLSERITLDTQAA